MGSKLSITTIILAIITIILPRMSFCSVNQSDSLNFEFPNKGSFALQYRIRDNLNLGSFLGEELSAKYYLEDSVAYKIGITIESSSLDYNGSYEYKNADGTVKNDVLEVQLQYVHSLAKKGRILPYICPGILFGSTTIDSIFNVTPNYDDYHYKSESTYYGGTIIIGAEYFIVEKVSLIFEYGMKLIFLSEKLEYDYDGKYDDIRLKGDRTVLSHVPIRFGLSVYLR